MTQTFDTRTAITFTFPDAAVTIADQGGGVAVDLSTAGVFGGLLAANNLSDVASAATARSNLGAAPLASPALTGTPTSTTAAPGTNTTQIATTEFVTAAIDAAFDANTVWIPVYIPDLIPIGVVSIFCPAPVSGTLSAIRVSASCQPSASIIFSTLIGGVAVTNGTATLLATDVIGTVKSGTPTAANVTVAGTTSIEVTFDLNNATAGTAVVLLGFLRTP